MMSALFRRNMPVFQSTPCGAALANGTQVPLVYSHTQRTRQRMAANLPTTIQILVGSMKVSEWWWCSFARLENARVDFYNT